MLADLHATANAPLFAAQSVYLGSGIVGGTMMSIDDLSSQHGRRGHSTLERRAAEKRQSTATTAGSTDIRLARVTAVGHRREPVAGGQRRALSRSEPVAANTGCTVLSAAGALVIQSLLIVGLLYQRRARQRAEIESRRNLALAADASRRADDVGADELDCP